MVGGGRVGGAKLGGGYCASLLLLAGVLTSGDLEGLDAGMEASMPILKSRAVIDDEVGVVDMVLALEIEEALARAGNSFGLTIGTGMDGVED